MIKLVVIADDFTGALDTGIKFAQTGANTRMFIGTDIDFEKLSDQCETIIVDTETRHKDPASSYRIVYDLVRQCQRHGVVNYYKKTDSAIRGCVGAELSALSDALGSAVHYVPALPSENRYTEGGIHYIDGTPVSQSVFGKDPFEPVVYDAVADIIADQSDCRVVNIAVTEEAVPGDDRALYVYDARTEEDLERIADRLSESNRLHATAGCAGFAKVLQKRLTFNDDVGSVIDRKDGIFIVCGTINDVTLRQIRYAEEHGFTRITLDPRQKLLAGYLDSEEGRAFLEHLERACRGGCPVIVDVDPGAHPISENDGLVRELDLDEDQLRERITERLGEIIEVWMGFGLNHVLILSGGDTAYGFLNKIGVREVTPIREVWQGAVLFSIDRDEAPLYIVSKSGGFGDEKFFIKTRPMLTHDSER